MNIFCTTQGNSKKHTKIKVKNDIHCGNTFALVFDLPKHLALPHKQQTRMAQAFGS